MYRVSTHGFWNPQLRLLVELKTYMELYFFFESKYVGTDLPTLKLKVNSTEVLGSLSSSSLSVVAVLCAQ